MKISYSKNYNVNRSFANAFKASVFAVGLVSACAANALILDSEDKTNLKQSIIIGNKVYELHNTKSTFYVYDLNNADDSSTIMAPDYSIDLSGIPNPTNGFTTDGNQFLFHGSSSRSGVHLLNASEGSTPIEIKTKDGKSIFAKDAAILGNYVVVGTQGYAYIFDISKASEADIMASQITLNQRFVSNFGESVAMHGSKLLVGAYGSNSVYLYNLNAGDETAINDSFIKITPIDDTISSSIYFGMNLAMNSKYALISANYYVNNEYNSRGAAYVYDITSWDSDAINASQIKLTIRFRDSQMHNNTSTTGQAISENGYVMLVTHLGPVLFDLNAGSEEEINASQVRITGNNIFYASMEGDTFVFENSNKTVVGNAKAVTTLDDGTFKNITGYGFESLGNWIIGENNSNNYILFNRNLAGGATYAEAIVRGEGRGVYIGKNAGSNNNTLRVLGMLNAANVYIGAEGNTGNTLIFGYDTIFESRDHSTVDNIYLADGNMLVFESEWQQDSLLLFEYLKAIYANLWAWDSTTGEYVLVDEDNYLDLLTISNYKDTDYMLVQTAIPEPAVAAAIIGALSLAFAAYRRRI